MGHPGLPLVQPPYSGRLLQLSRLTAGAIKAPTWRWRKPAPAASRRGAALDRLPEPTVRADAEGAPRSENRSRTEPEVAVGSAGGAWAARSIRLAWLPPADPTATRTNQNSALLIARSKDARRQAARDRTRPTTGGHRGPADRRHRTRPFGRRPADECDPGGTRRAARFRLAIVRASDAPRVEQVRAFTPA